MPLGIIIALVVALGGGISLAAQSSLPGDSLYPVKVGVNEEVRAGFATSAEAKAAFDVKRAEARLEEAEELSVEKEVDAQTRAGIEANFKTFADRVQSRITALAEVDARAAADLASNFEVALRAHEKVLARLAARDAQTMAELKALAARVRAEAGESTKLRADAEAKLTREASVKGDASAAARVTSAADVRIQAAADAIASARAYVNMQRASLGADAMAKAEARLKEAESILAQAEAKAKAGAHAAAYVLANTAIRTANEARLLIRVQQKLDIDLNLGGSADVRVEGSLYGF